MIKSIYESFALRWYRGGSIWIISDPHFNDPDMPSIRKNYIGDDELVKRINSKVGKKDTLIILGDIGDVEFVKKLKGYKVLIMGNHDKGASNYERKLIRQDIIYEEEIDGEIHEEPGVKLIDNHLFNEVYEGALMISPKIILSHEPIPNLPEWLFNIHGHDHSNWFTGSRHLNVCAEHIDYYPINLNSIIKDGLLKDIEDIHRITIDGAIARKAKKKK